MNDVEVMLMVIVGIMQLFMLERSNNLQKNKVLSLIKLRVQIIIIDVIYLYFLILVSWCVLFLIRNVKVVIRIVIMVFVYDDNVVLRLFL